MAQKRPVDIIERTSGGDIEPALAYEVTAEGKIGLGVFVQDQTTPSIFVKASLVTNETTNTDPTAIGSYELKVTSATGITATTPGSFIGVFNIATGRFYQGRVLAISTLTLTMDTPFDSVFPVGSIVGIGVSNMNVNGSVTPVVFSVRGADPGLDLVIDITKIRFTCITDSPVDLSKFGDIAALTRGVLLRRTDGTVVNIITYKSNIEMLNWIPYAATNPAQGIDGFVATLRLGGQSEVGVVIRLAAGEELEIVIQDDLQALTLLEALIIGHIVQ